MQTIGLVKDAAYRRGHLPMRDDARQDRVSLICAHCGAQAAWKRGELRGLLLAEGGKCIGFEPKSRRQLEIEEMDAEYGWTGARGIDIARWAVSAAWAMNGAVTASGLRV